MRGGNGVVIAGNHPARVVCRMLRPWEGVLRTLPRLVLVLVLVALSSWSAAVTDGTAAGAAAAGSPVLRPLRPCGDLTSVSLLSPTRVPVQLSSARVSGVNGAGYCDVMGEIGPGFSFDLHLPQSTYEGQYVQEGCGGFCGFAWPSAPFVADGCPAVTGNTLAIAVDNEGHASTSTTDARWAANNTKNRIIFGSTSEHQLAFVAKALIADYYGSPPSYSYFDGCSDGGREALMEAQRYPHDFNGILAGAPGNIWSELLGEVESWNIRVNTGSGGREILTSEKLPALHAAVVRACGHGRGYVLDPRTCNFSPSRIECRGPDSNSCLTAAQVRVATLLYSGPSDPAGEALYPGGEPYGSELGWPTWFVKPSGDRDWPHDTVSYQLAINFLRYMAYRTDPAGSYSLSQFPFTLSGYRTLTALSGLYDATNPDLSSFAADGGRLIIYQGWADQAIPPFGTVGYYKSVVEDAGGYKASQTFSRLYMVPAQYHCLAGGDPGLAGADLLTPLIDWVQNGTPPGTLSFSLASTETSQGGATGDGVMTVAPLDPLTPLPSGSHGLNANDDWVGSFAPREPG